MLRDEVPGEHMYGMEAALTGTFPRCATTVALGKKDTRLRLGRTGHRTGGGVLQALGSERGGHGYP